MLTALVLLIYLGGGVPSWAPWVSIIPQESYYLWEAVFRIPYSLVTWVLFAALAHLFAKMVNGAGSLEGTLAVLGFTYSIPLLLLFWLPDLLQFLVWGLQFQSWLVAIYGTIAGIWMVILSCLGVKVVQGTSWRAACLATLPALAVTGVMAILLIR